MMPEEREAEGVKLLPHHLREALKEFANSDLIRWALGEHIFASFYEAKQIEWEICRSQVNQWELDQCLAIF
jgi:glutamine synthetase